MPARPLGGVFFAVLTTVFGWHALSGAGAIEACAYVAAAALAGFLALITTTGWKEPKWMSSELTEEEVAALARSRWVDTGWLALKEHTRWRDDMSRQSAKASDALRAWVNRQPTMPLESLVACFDREFGAEGPKSEPRARGFLRRVWGRVFG